MRCELVIRAAFRVMLLNGVAWVATLAIPEGGVLSPTPPNEELEAMLTKVLGPPKP
jgi:hypothetical protein